MNRKHSLFLVAIIMAVALGFWGLNRAYPKNSQKSAKLSEHGEKTEEFERGPHGGRLLRNKDLAIEITIFEDNAPPQFRLYAYEKDQPIAGSQVQVSIELSRLDGEVNLFKFSPQADFLESKTVVAEPHSFDVKVEATYNGNLKRWSFSSYEGRTTIVPESAEAAGIKTDEAGPAPILEKLSLSGRITMDPSRTAQVRARFPGIVREIRKKIGEQVAISEVLATVENNDSLQVYPIISPIGGVITASSSNVGDVTNDSSLFTVADLSEVWAEFHIFPKDLNRVKVGQKIQVKSLTDDVANSATVTMVSPVADVASQTVLVRAALKNSNGQWPSGMAVNGELVLSERIAPLAVKTSAVQRFRDFSVVFAQVDHTYEVRMLSLGASDGSMVEVLEGLKSGTTYVSENSFLIKADIEKSGASHDH